MERARSCLIFGLAGVGKTHLAAGLARRMVELGMRAKFFAANALFCRVTTKPLTCNTLTLCYTLGSPKDFKINGSNLLHASTSFAVSGRPFRVASNIFIAFRAKPSFLIGSFTCLASASN